MMEDNFSPQQSLLLIQSMIDKTKDNISHNRIYFLLWGWLTFAGFIGQYVLKVIVGYQHHYAVWLITVLGLALTVYYNKQHSKKQAVRTYLGDAMGYFWMGMGISFSVLCFILTFQSGKNGWLYCYPFFIMMYGLGTFISGKLLQFRPLAIGGIVNWMLACAAVFISYDHQILLAAAAILISYIVPGYLIKPSQHAE